MNNATPERVLYVIPRLCVCGGMESYAMNYLRHIDRSRYVFDFVTHDVAGDNYISEIEELGGRVYVLPAFTIRNLAENKRRIKKILTEGEYGIIHCHMANAGYFYFKEAKNLGVPVRILHSHQSRAADKFTHALRNCPLLYLARHYATHFVACSKVAGDFLFGREPYTILRNAIDTADFAPDDEARVRVRAKLGADEDTLVVGHVGRFCPQKNQAFLLEIMKNVIALHPDSRLLLVGEGEDEAFLRSRAEAIDIADNVFFYGTSRAVSDLYRAMDVFCMPSLYEGLSVVAVEAQAAGVPCIFSSNMSPETALGSCVEMLSLKTPAMEWAKRIVALGHAKRPEDPTGVVRAAGYDITLEADRLLDYYDKVKALTDG